MDYESLNKEDVNTIEAIQRRIDSTVEILTSDLQFLIESLKDYKESMKTMTASALGEADILVKYSTDSSNNAYNLPGVFSSTVANYDTGSIRNDNLKLKDFKEKHETFDNKRTSVYSMISGTYNEIRTRLNLLATDNQNITSKLEDLLNK